MYFSWALDLAQSTSWSTWHHAPSDGRRSCPLLSRQGKWWENEGWGHNGIFQDEGGRWTGCHEAYRNTAWRRHVFHRTTIFCWGYSCLSLVVEFCSCYSDGREDTLDYLHARCSKVHSVVLFCHRCHVYLTHYIVSARSSGVFGGSWFFVLVWFF